jgi:hypothetical protein
VLLASKVNTGNAIERIKSNSDGMTDDVAYLVQFIETSERGIIK